MAFDGATRSGRHTDTGPFPVAETRASRRATGSVPVVDAPGGRGGDSSPLIARAIDLSKVYGSGEAEVRALDRVSVDFERGRLTAIMGPSGSGKSTLMHCMAALDRPSSGKVVINGIAVEKLNDKKLTRLRRDRLGFIFQSFNLVPTLSARENITLPLDIAGRPAEPGWLAEVVAAVGLQDRLGHRPTELSGGQQQRVACARALVSRPAVVFADEPTGNLDRRAGAEVLALLQRSVRDLGQTVVMVTHDPVAAAYAERVVFLADGRVVGELRDPTSETVLDRIKSLERDAPAVPAAGPVAPAAARVVPTARAEVHPSERTV